MDYNIFIRILWVTNLNVLMDELLLPFMVSQSLRRRIVQCATIVGPFTRCREMSRGSLNWKVTSQENYICAHLFYRRMKTNGDQMFDRISELAQWSSDALECVLEAHMCVIRPKWLLWLREGVDPAICGTCFNNRGSLMDDCSGSVPRPLVDTQE